MGRWGHPGTWSAICLLVGTASGLISAPAQATEFHFSGFATAAAGTTLEAGTRYQVEPTTQGAYDDEVSFEPESVAGLQVQAVVNERLRATLQVVAKGADDFDAELDWAFISYDLQPNLTFNAGRYRLPLFFYSESIDVGYSYYWIRPPVEVYRIFTANLEGVNLYHTHFIQELEISTQVWYGTIDSELDLEPITVELDTRRNAGINATLGWEWFRLRLLYNDVKIDTRINIPTGDPFNPITQQSKADVTFTAVAFMADVGPFLWRSEWTQADDKELDVSRTGYVSMAYQLGQWVPHLTHAREKARELPEAFDRATNTLGLAWYFDQSVVAKVEYSASETEYRDRDSDVELVSVALDMVF
ncbi:hypothetical protein [Ketobacter sp.]|uniref:hypothetical protein n=1 Tax=Ketobacter sp. TaxID=2083498 RepID=UPI000F140DC9|nr:hypothetical protein [Ketobacter sp.]RLT99261.1 MAG: hypothetical protein D9N14_08965 [Ketobacter sp.]